LTAQAAIEWGCERPAFGIKPARALRSLVIQAEDDEGDISEMCQIVNHLNLTPDEKAAVGSNVHFEFVNDSTGRNFIDSVDGFLDQLTADLLWINPYTSYLGGDSKDEQLNTIFLRNWLNPVLTKHRCAAMIVHHTPKTNFRDTSNWKASDWMYAGAGAATLTNWARAMLVIDPTGIAGCYKFIAAKRGKRIGWGYDYPTFEAHYSHSKADGKLLWVPSTEAEIKATIKTEKTADDLFELLPIAEELTKEQIQGLAKAKLGIGQKRAFELVKELMASGEIDCRDHPRAGTKPEKKYVRTR
jgi:hypothetical protein